MSSESRTIERDLAIEEALEALVRRAQAGEEAAFEELLDRFEARALLIARGMGASRQDAEDVVQEAFLSLFRYIRSYRSGRSFQAWFYRIVINASRDHRARAAGHRHAPLEEAGDLAAAGAATGQDARVEELRRALQRLPQRERETVILRDLQGLSAWQVARILRISPITVRRHSMRGLARLKGLLAERKDR